MKTVTSTLLLVTLVLTGVSLAKPRMPGAKILDMYAVKEGDSFVVHIIADGNISEFLSDRKTGDGTYKLTLDVPALSPLNTQYDIDTPFSRRFEVWPMQLGKKIYSRVELELDTDTSSVVGVENESHVFVRIQKEGALVVPTARAVPTVAVESEPQLTAPTEPAAAEPGVAVTVLGVLPVEEPPFSEDSDGDEVEPAPPATPLVADAADSDDPEKATGSADEELFFNLFPAPVRARQTLFNVAPIEDTFAAESVAGIRVGRFAIQPSVDASYIRGSNLLLLNDETFSDNALMVRGRIVASLLDSVNELKIAYEGRYRDFETFTLEDRYTNVFDINTTIETSPRSSFALTNHFIHGSFESQEFDPGGEVVASTDPFYRNMTDGTFDMEISERLGAEISGRFNRVEFLEPGSDFFSYDATTFGGGILYNLSPLTSLVGEYLNTRTRPDLSRPEATSDGHLVLFGMRGEITPLLRGRIRAGFAKQSFPAGARPLEYNGFVADVSLAREFGEQTALNVTVGRRTTPSAYEQNGFYVSNYGTARFVVPIAEKLRFSASGVVFGSDYPLADLETGLERNDTSLSSALGVSYFFTPLSYFSVDYRYDRRRSTLDQFSYRNNAVQFMVGFGFLNR